MRRCFIWAFVAAIPVVAEGAAGTAAVVPLAHDAWITHVAFSADGGRMASTGFFNDRRGIEPQVYLWDLREHRELRHFSRHDLPDPALVFTPDGRRLVVLGRVNPFHPTKNGALQIFDVDAGKELLSLGDKAVEYESVAVSPSGARLAAIGHGSGEQDTFLDVFDLTNGKLRRRIQRGPYDFADHLHFVGEDVVEGIFPGILRSWRLEDGRSREDRFEVIASLGNWAAAADGSTIVTHTAGSTVLREAGELSVLGPGTGSVRVHDGRTGKVRHRLPDLVHREVRGVAFSADGRRIAFVTSLQALMRMHIEAKWPDDVAPEISIVDVDSGRICQRLDRSRAELALPTRPNYQVHLAFTTDGASLALFGYDQTVRLVAIEGCP